MIFGGRGDAEQPAHTLRTPAAHKVQRSFASLRMTTLWSALPRTAFSAMAALFLVGVAGCQTPLTFPKPDATWQTRVGQLRYAGPERSVIGECVVSRRGADEFQLEFRAGPGIPLMHVWRAKDTVRAEGVFAQGQWEGEAPSAPKHLRGWVNLNAIFAQASPASRQLEINAVETGEHFTFVFAE